ncbi:hypothetical protein [Streptomyces hoynatensis]|uniref:hypothetical protein n=1 Tax=Streptomyces hoynatensis TaxID=1141874 RepID=UPI0011C419B2|nr:hypothetical protein [Streptomyces hoynatensis]
MVSGVCPIAAEVEAREAQARRERAIREREEEERRREKRYGTALDELRTFGLVRDYGRVPGPSLSKLERILAILREEDET